MNQSPAFQKAMELIGQDPMPDDIVEQMDKLEKEIDPSESEMFGDLWEAIYASGQIPLEKLSNL